METEQNQNTPKKINILQSVAAIIGIAVIGFGAVLLSKNTKNKNTKTEPAQQIAQNDQQDTNVLIKEEALKQEATIQEIANQKKEEEKSVGDEQTKKDTQPLQLIPPQTPKKQEDTKQVSEQKQPEKETLNQGLQPTTQTEKASQPAEEQKPVQENVTKQEEPVIQKKEFADGTYSAVGNYSSPAGGEEVVISLTLKDTLVTDSQFTGKATHPTSKQWQNAFGSGYKEKIIGKSIKELSLTVISGSSLTPKGFMDALEKIQQQAKNT